MVIKNEMSFIALVGGVGVGKTHFGRKFKNTYPDIVFVEEDLDKNLYLNEFYQDMKKWGFHSRISMLSMILNQTLPFYNRDKFVLTDRCVNELIVFATKEHEDGNLTEKEFDLYKQLYSSIVRNVPEPDLYLFFDCSPETALQRIKARGRAYEMDVSLEFVEDVLIRYRNWRDSIDNSRVIDINSEDEVDPLTIKSMIFERLEAKCNA